MSRGTMVEGAVEAVDAGVEHARFLDSIEELDAAAWERLVAEAEDEPAAAELVDRYQRWEWPDDAAVPPIRWDTPTTLERIGAALDDHDPELDHTVSPRGRLESILAWRRLAARVEARLLGQVRRAEASDAAAIVHGVGTRTWLAQAGRITARESGRVVARAERLGRFGQVEQALAAGRIGIEQSDAIVDALTQLPPEFDLSEIAAAQTSLLGYAAQFDTAGLRRLAHHLVEVIAPQVAEDHTRERLERERRTAEAGRGLWWGRDGHGSVHLTGRLPLYEGEELIALIDAHVAADRSRYATTDPLAEVPSAAAMRADALCRIVAAHARAQAAPSHGGDRPRVVITLDGDDLGERTANGATASGAPLAPSEVRRVACDAGIVPVVLGGAGQVLDVGAEQRLATAAIRIGLAARDGGCVMPGCDRPPAECEAHHVIPWQTGGPTALGNLVLLCRTHHRVIEPDPHRRPGSQWEIGWRPDGLPEVIPPDRVDPHRRPIRHPRHRHPGHPGSDSNGDNGDNGDDPP